MFQLMVSLLRIAVVSFMWERRETLESCTDERSNLARGGHEVGMRGIWGSSAVDMREAAAEMPDTA